MLAALAS